MKNTKSFLALLAVFVALAWSVFDNQGQGPPAMPAESSRAIAAGGIDAAFRNGTSDVVLETRGRVSRVLPDDRDGSPHQRFIVETPSGLTVLIAHNIALAPRVDGLAVGQSITVKGEYEWNEKGGVIHWTHRDPRGRHEAGWIRYNGQRYD